MTDGKAQSPDKLAKCEPDLNIVKLPRSLKTLEEGQGEEICESERPRRINCLTHFVAPWERFEKYKKPL